VNSDFIPRGAETQRDLQHLRALVASVGQQAAAALERHLARPRYRPALTRILEHGGEQAGYALIGHRRLWLGAASVETGDLEAIYLAPDAQGDADALAALLGDCLRTLLEEGLPLARIAGPIEIYGPYGFAPYHFVVAVDTWAGLDLGDALRAARLADLDDLAALYDASYRALPLAEALATPDWHWRLDTRPTVVLEDSCGRVVAYAAFTEDDRHERGSVVEGAAADAGAARRLLGALGEGRLELPLGHVVARAALHLGGVGHVAAPEPQHLPILAGEQTPVLTLPRFPADRPRRLDW
jgi:hypothetical protein